ncbi:MAG: DUF4147 domain-containing protein [Kofleriaceae bacterium]|jgi:glycerate 2-kinase|nr:DUF4147 domain-containing protein [Kofleriaceae bacterium]MBP6841229.1 DUF4147 domain-containing protein [Kofleriaceae bacterium]MBP9208288.1 DUF4147 domain-containing protein [Kofleriaceae bacterium]
MTMISPLRRRLEQVFRASLSAVDPGARVRTALARPEVVTALTRRPIHVLAIGKAAFPMARAAASSLAALHGAVVGLVVAPEPGELPGFSSLVGQHPVPGEGSLLAGQSVWAMAASTPATGALLVLVSGGASALAEVYADGVIPAEGTHAISALAHRGAPIGDVNAMRRGISAIKGGRLALVCPAPVVTVAISDVVGDDLEIIGSGPTVGPWTAGEGRTIVRIDEGMHDAALRRLASEVWNRHFGRRGLPASVERHLSAPPRLGRMIDRPADVVALAAGVATMRKGAATAARAVGWEPVVMAADLVGDVDEVAQRLVVAAERLGPGRILVAGGEPTVTLPAEPGRGGRAQHLALTMARRWAGRSDRATMVLGSDGVDGPGPGAPAGAFVDANTWQAIADLGIDPTAALARCDSGTALGAVGALVSTGPTGVNHADLVLVTHP